MELSYNWLKQYIDLSDMTPETLAESLTLAGLEVEQITTLANASNLVIGEVIEIEDHPDSDKLRLTKVDIKDEILQIVCGAPNVDKGQKVIVAKVGANVNGLKIKDAVIRGVESFGMICSLSELGVSENLLSEDQLKGIEVLADDAPVGSSAVLEYLKLDDVLIEIGLTPNRSDCLAMFNLVHEISAILERKVKFPEINDHSEGVETELNVSLESDQSLQILGKVIGNVTLKPSVPWMVDILRANGMQPINNIVDISNIVMLETGQPLHFYDADKLPALELSVKDGFECEYTALDEKTYKIQKEDLCITSNGEIVGIAGIMGGENSKITEETKSIVIEAAHFDLARVRISSRNLNISSEAASRFSKGIDPNAIFYATNRAIDLLIEYADASDISKDVIAGERNLDAKNIKTSPDYINNRLGLNLTAEEITKIFERLNFNPVQIDNVISTYVPTYRLDIESEVDLSEEVIRLYGVDKLPTTMPYVRMMPAKKNKRVKEKEALINTLLGGGFSETVSYSLVSQKHLDYAVMPIGEPVELSNPISNDKKFYRPSLFASMLDVIAYNEARNNTTYSLYELANVYDDHGNTEERLSIAFSIKHERSIWEDIINIENFYSFKGIMESLLSKLGITRNRIKVRENTIATHNFHPHQSAELYIDNKLFGVMGKTHPSLEEAYDINTSLMGEFNLEVLYNAKKSKVKYTPIPKFPGISRDIAIIAPEELASEKLITTILLTGKPLVVDAEVFDVYQGDNIDEGLKSIAIRISYQAMDRTLTDEDVSEVHENIVERLIKEYNIIYRK